MAVILCFTRLQTIILCSSPLEDKLPWLQLKWFQIDFPKCLSPDCFHTLFHLNGRKKGRANPQINHNSPLQQMERGMLWVCTCVTARACRIYGGQCCLLCLTHLEVWRRRVKCAPPVQWRVVLSILKWPADLAGSTPSTNHFNTRKENIGLFNTKLLLTSVQLKWMNSSTKTTYGQKVQSYTNY